MLIYAGANVRATTRLGAYTPLYLAAKGGHSAVVAALLAAGADAKATTSNGTTPLMIAAAAGDTRSITSLDRERRRDQRERHRQGRDAVDVRGRLQSHRCGEAAARARRRSQGHDHGRRSVRADRAGRRSDGPRHRRQRRGGAPAGESAGRYCRRHARLPLQRADQHAGRAHRAAVCRAPGLHRHRQGVDRGRRRHQSAECRRQDQPAADGDHQRPLRSREVPAREGREPQCRRLQRRRAAVCGAEPAVVAQVALSEPEGAPTAADLVPRDDAGAARQGRRPERARRPQGLVPGLQLRLRRLRRSRRDAVLPRRLRQRRRRDAAARRARRRPEHSDGEAGGPSVHR